MKATGGVNIEQSSPRAKTVRGVDVERSSLRTETTRGVGVEQTPPPQAVAVRRVDESDQHSLLKTP